MLSGFTRWSMTGQVRGLSVMPMLSGMRISNLSRAKLFAELFTELWWPLLAEGAAALLRFLGAVVEGDRLEAERADGALVFGVDVERALGDRDGRGASFDDLGAPLVHLGVELFGRHHRVDEAH